MQAIERQPLPQVAGTTLVGWRKQYTAAVLFPAQQQTSDCHDKEEEEQGCPERTVHFSENAQDPRLSLAMLMFVRCRHQ